MQFGNFKIAIGAIVAALGFMATTGSPAKAATLYNGWNYSIDAADDGSGGPAYELRGMTIKITATEVLMALTGDTPPSGVSVPGALGGGISWGDLFLNFSGNHFQPAIGTQEMYGIRFMPSNDSGVPNLGIYQGVTGRYVTLQNSGYANLDAYYNAGFDRPGNTMGDITTQAEAYDYFGQTAAIPPVMDGGTQIGTIALLTQNELQAEGLDFNHFNATGSQTLGFKFNKALLPTKNFVAHLFLECLNDGIALKGSTTAVPEPTTLGGLALAGLGLGMLRRRRSKE